MRPKARLCSTALLATMLAGTATCSLAASQDAGLQGCPVPGARVAEPYRWYPALDLARIPFHTGAGAWGPRAAIIAPEPPVTLRTVRVTTASQLAAAALVPGTLITVDADFIGHAVVFGDVSDVDIVVPPGRRVAQLTIGRFSPPSTTRRVRVRGTMPGTHSGGLIGKITFVSRPSTDVIIDGVDLNGDDDQGGNMLWHLGNGAERVAIVNVRGHGVGAVSLQSGFGDNVDVVIAGNRIMSGARPREVNGYPEGWGIRGGDRIVIYANRIDGTRYHRVRVEARSGPPQYAWVADNTFVDPNEARIFTAGGRPEARYAAVWVVCNRVYAHSKCFSPSFEAPQANYAMLTSNAFFGSVTEIFQRKLQAAHGQGRDYLSGNTFSAWQAPPAWEAPGDPTVVPLPPVRPERYNQAIAFRPCPGP